MSAGAPRAPALPDIMRETLDAGLLGFCTAGPDGRVLRRDGALSLWAPAPGAPLFDHPVMECLREAVFALRATGGEIILPGLGMREAAGDLKLDIRFVWMDAGGYLLVTSSQAAARAELEAATAQARRETHILEERVRAQELHLAGQRALMALFIASAPAAIAMLGKDLRYVAVSDRWLSDFGIAAGAAQKGMAFSPTLPGASARWQQGLADALAGADSECALDAMTGAHGRADYVRWRFLPWEMSALPGADMAGSGVILFCEIITAQVEQAQELERQARALRGANADMRSFSLALSHDLQAPLRQMVKFAQLFDLEAGAALTGTGRDFLDEIHAAGARMQRMITGLLRYLRIAAKKPALFKIDLGLAVLAAQDNLRLDIEQARARIATGPMPQVAGDPELLTLLFQNLLHNSLKFAAGGAPAIQISAARSGSAWQIDYRDNGPGIPAAGMPKAFDLFQRLDTRPGIAGTGVGLAICRWIAEVHNATIAIDPDFRGGLRILLTLSGAEAAAPVSSAAPAAAAA